MSNEQKPIELKLFINGKDYSDVLSSVAFNLEDEDVKTIEIELANGARMPVIKQASANSRKTVDFADEKSKNDFIDEAAGKDS